MRKDSARTVHVILRKPKKTENGCVILGNRYLLKGMQKTKIRTAWILPFHAGSGGASVSGRETGIPLCLQTPHALYQHFTVRTDFVDCG